MFRLILAVGAGSFFGGVVRYLFSRWLYAGFPWGTFAVNVIGCFLIGLLNGVIERSGVVSSELCLFLTVGFCGGFTTFSTFMGENFFMLRAGEFLPLAFNLVGSVLFGFLSVWAGYWIGARI